MRVSGRHCGLRALVLAVSFAWTLPQATVLHAQQGEDLQKQIADSQRRLEEIRSERGRLQTELLNLRSQVRDVSGELQNIERQLSASRSVVAEVDFQTEAISTQVQVTSSDLARTRERLRERSATLHRRLRDIFKRGPLNSVRVLLGADSFAELLNRYRYLHLIAASDRVLVNRVKLLEGSLVSQGDELQGQLAELGRLRQQKLEELAELREVESSRQGALRGFRSAEALASGRLGELEADERRLTNLVGDLEERRLELERRRRVAGAPAAGPSTLGSSDAGSLDWPVDGEVIYGFGREQQPNGTVLRWNGIGIRAAPGTPVRAVRAGTVVLAGPFEGYGPTVVLSHGDGFYTLYLYLDEVGVVEGRDVAAGQVVGTVGGTDTPEGAHIEFQVRAPIGSGPPQAMDPIQWLRAPGGEQ